MLVRKVNEKTQMQLWLGTTGFTSETNCTGVCINHTQDLSSTTCGCPSEFTLSRWTKLWCLMWKLWMKADYFSYFLGFVFRRSSLFLLAMYRAGPEDLWGIIGPWLWGDLHARGSAPGAWRSYCHSALTGLRTRGGLCRQHPDGFRSQSRRNPKHREHLCDLQDCHTSQRNGRTHRIPHFCYQTTWLEA